jgi:hypothetical protein
VAVNYGFSVVPLVSVLGEMWPRGRTVTYDLADIAIAHRTLAEAFVW